MYADHLSSPTIHSIPSCHNAVRQNSNPFHELTKLCTMPNCRRPVISVSPRRWPVAGNGKLIALGGPAQARAKQGDDSGCRCDPFVPPKEDHHERGIVRLDEKSTALSNSRITYPQHCSQVRHEARHTSIANELPWEEKLFQAASAVEVRQALPEVPLSQEHLVYHIIFNGLGKRVADKRSSTRTQGPMRPPLPNVLTLWEVKSKLL